MASAGHWCMLVCVACLVLLIQESVAPRVHSSRKGSIRRRRPFPVQVQQAKPDSGSEGSSQTSTTTKYIEPMAGANLQLVTAVIKLVEKCKFSFSCKVSAQ